MNVQRSPETITVTDASGKTVTVAAASQESKNAIARVIAKHREALIRLADR